MKTIACIALAVLSLSYQRVASQIKVSSAQTAAALAQKLAGEGVIILNPTLNCSVRANAFFNVVHSNLGLDSGIVLTTGHAATLGSSFGVNGQSSFLASNDNGVGGDAMLDVLAGQPTVDACDLEFDVVPSGDTIRFTYVFSSEEYKNAVCGPYNDAFAFFISGPGIASTDNMALIPGTNIPVTINSINNGVPGSSGNLSNCTRMGPGSPFTSYYIDNSSGTTLTHYGLTVPLQAIHAVQPCGTYHLKIVIADAGDPLYDSGVFLKAGSLQTANYNINALLMPSGDTSLAYCVKGCLPGKFKVRRTQTSNRAQTIKYITAGSAISGVDYSPLPDSVVIPANDSIAYVVVNGLPTPLNGTKTLQLFIQSPYACTSVNNIVDSAMLQIYDTIHISMLTPDTTICGSDSVQLLVAGNGLFTYSWTPDADLTNPAEQDPIAFPYENTTYTVKAYLPGSSCVPKTADINFTIKLTPHIRLGADTSVCYNTPIGLNAATTEANDFYSYQWSGPAGFSSTLLAPVINNAVADMQGIYSLEVVNDTNSCKAEAKINVTVNTPDTPSVVSPIIFCLDKPAEQLTAKGSNLLWYAATDSVGDTAAPLVPTDAIAVYDYYVTQSVNNCISPKVNVAVEVKKCCDGRIAIPNAFTPNDDGHDDIFRPIEDYGYFIESMYIFNRWGQLIYSGLHGGWDGKFGGKAADMGTYFYNITFGCIIGGETMKKGEVTLLR